MADALTSTFGLTKIEVGASENTWGTKLNDNADDLDGLLARGSYWATYGGAADAITLALVQPLLAYVAGLQLRFRATAANTGAATVNVDGLGAKTLKAVTGAALPAGYIRTDVDTVITYDGTDFIARRAVEYGTNANGSYRRFEDGVMECWGSESASTGGEKTWTFPKAFSSAPVSVTCTPAVTGAAVFSTCGNYTPTTAQFSIYNTGGTRTGTNARLVAHGKWF